MRTTRGTLAGLAALAVCAWLLIPGADVDVAIPSGLSASQTAALLKDKGIIRSRWLFRAAAKLTGTDRRLRPGSYRLRRHMPLPLLLRRLGSGANQGLKVVIPEGFSSWQIAERLQALGVCSAEAFRKYVKAERLEGFLFPTTYYFAPQTAPDAVARRMEQEFRRRLEPEYRAAGSRPELTLDQAATLASIVEREAVHPEEKPMIAAVYLNRLRLRMRLDADPTVQYALGRWKKGLNSEDLRTDSPYNTYIHYGLPPGPISSPGEASFRAVLSPADTDAIYFVADNKGGHVFSATHEEHLKAKRSFKRELRRIKARLKIEEEARKAGLPPAAP